MKPVLDWVKSNLVAVICIAVVVVSLPAALFFSMRMNGALVERVQNEVGASERDLQGLDVNYQAESLDPRAPAVDFRRPPNAATTEALKAFMDRVSEASEAVVERAVAINSAGKTPLMDGFFPAPESDALAMRQQFGELWVPAHRRLLEEAETGAPPDPAQVRADVSRSLEERQARMLTARADQSLTPDEVAQLREEMTEYRLDIYRRIASDLTCYATPEVFAFVQTPDPTQPVSLERAWDMQHRFWMHEDILRAVQEANAIDGPPFRLRVPEGVVKRIESIVVEPWYFEAASVAQPTAPLSAPVAPDYEVSITGRTSWPGQPNGLYDARFADVTLLVASDQIPRLVEAFSSVNLMSVVAMQVESIDAMEDLEAGFFYGNAHVVRVSMRIETLWLRPWMEPLMPEGVRRALGVPTPVNEATDEMNNAADRGQY